MARRKKRDDDHGGIHPDERWLITYADMITLLLAVFVVLYALSDTNIRKFVAFAQSVSMAFSTDVFTGTTAYTVAPGQEAAPDAGRFDAGQGIVASDFRAVSAAVGDYAVEEGVAGQVSVDRVSEGIAIRISSSLLFQSGRARLDESSVDVVDRIAGALVGLPNRLRVEGHTDDIAPDGIFYRDNWQLSTARALSVLDRLAGDGIAPARLSAAGYAEYRPLVPNTDAAARIRNRRVDILILYPTTAPGGAGDAPDATGSSDPFFPPLTPGVHP